MGPSLKTSPALIGTKLICSSGMEIWFAIVVVNEVC